ncbi:MAG: retropepsin-like aspartic protease family protein [Gammaproteobacteria bacterium]
MKPEQHPNQPTGRAKSTRSMGHLMLLLAFALLLGMVTWFMQGRLDALYNPNQNLSASSTEDGQAIHLERNRYGHYVASGTINDVPVVFLLDTGATHVSVPATIAERIGLRAGRAQRVNTANGSIQVYSTILDSVRLGPLELRDVRGGINPHMEGNEVLLGMSFLKHLNWSQCGGILTLSQRDTH